MAKRAAGVTCIVILIRQSYDAICQLILTNRENQITIMQQESFEFEQQTSKGGDNIR